MEIIVIIIIAVIVIVLATKKSKNKEEQTTSTGVDIKIKMSGRTVSETSEEYEKANSLIKEASALRKENIEVAITKIKEALNICPDYYGGYNKLAKYQIAANDIEDAKKIISGQLKKFKKDSFKHSDATGRAEWISINFYCYKDPDNIIKSNLYDMYFDILINSLNGETKQITCSINDFIKQNFNRKFTKAISGKVNSTKIIKGFEDWLISNKQYFTQMSSIYNRIDFYKKMEKDAMEGINTDGDYEHRVLLKNKNFCEAFEQIKESRFESFLTEAFNL